jgi:hypothetical protein
VNLSAMRTAVLTRLGTPGGDGFYSTAQLNDFVNEALQTVSTEHDWPWLAVTTTFTTTAGTATYTVPSNWQRTKALTVDGQTSLQLRSLTEIREILSTAQAEPEMYAIFPDSTIILRPVPNSAYTVIHDYIAQEPILSSDSETPLMPAQFHYAVVEFAVYLAHMREGRMPDAQIRLAAYQGWLDRMHDNRRRSSSPIRVRVRPGRDF